PGANELMGECAMLDADTEEFGLETQLRRPVEGHQVVGAAVRCPTSYDIQPVGHLPQHAPAKLVVLLGVRSLRERANGFTGRTSHPADTRRQRRLIRGAHTADG